MLFAGLWYHAGMHEGTVRAEIYPGLEVDVVLKKDQPTGKLTRGIVQDVLTSSANHPRGIKVRLEDGRVGRVQAIVNGSDDGNDNGDDEKPYDEILDYAP